MWTGKTRNTRRTGLTQGWIAVGAIGASLLAGCGGGGGGNDSASAEESLPGVWRVSRIETGGQSTTCPGEINATSCGANDTATFYENHAFTGTSAGAGAYAGTWQLSGKTLTITITTPTALASTETETINFSGENTFTSESPDGTKSTFVQD